MQHNNTPGGELSYFETALLLHLRKSHPHMAGNPDFISQEPMKQPMSMNIPYVTV